MANPSITTPATERILTAAEVREHFKYLESAEDGLLEAFIDAATDHVETTLRRAFVLRTLTLYLTGFEDDRLQIARPTTTGEIWLPFPPLAGITSIKYDDEGGVERTLDAGDYVFDTISEPGRVKPAVNTSWPATEAGAYNTVRIAYTAGYATAAAVPERFKQIVRWVVALWFRNREPVAPVDLRVVPHTVDEFLNQYAMLRVGG